MVGYHGSPFAAAMCVLLTVAFLAVTVARATGRFAHLDLRIVAHVVPVGYHPRLLAAVHPLVHLGDAAFVLAVTLPATLVLWLLGYRRSWAVLLVGLSWPVELGCKAIMSQPALLGAVRETVRVGDLARGPGAITLLDWFNRATPDGVGALVRHAGNVTVGLSSSYPSGSTARGAFVLGLLIWAALRLRIVVMSELLALALLAPMAGLGFAVVLFAWHWPADVLGGYLLGLALLAASLALLRLPHASPPSGAASPIQAPSHGPHSPHSRLPWVVHES